MSDQGVAWLARLEGGVKLKAYLDSRGIPTIGVGQTYIRGNTGWRRVSMSDQFPDVGAAMQAFRNRLDQDEVAIDACTRDDISQTVFDAFVSARFNIGPAFDRSECVFLYNSGAPILKVAESLRNNWHRAGERAHVLDSRRNAECDLILKGIYRTQGEIAA